jgi:hypothetical protein
MLLNQRGTKLSGACRQPEDYADVPTCLALPTFCQTKIERVNWDILPLKTNMYPAKNCCAGRSTKEIFFYFISLQIPEINISNNLT